MTFFSRKRFAFLIELGMFFLKPKKIKVAIRFLAKTGTFVSLTVFSVVLVTNLDIIKGVSGSISEIFNGASRKKKHFKSIKVHKIILFKL